VIVAFDPWLRDGALAEQVVPSPLRAVPVASFGASG
jgi:hypothetical protein